MTTTLKSLTVIEAFAVRGTLVALAVMLWPLCARAQTASPSPIATVAPSPVASATPIPAPSAVASPAAPAFTGVLGDFGGGERSKLATYGVDVNGRLGTEATANLSGGAPLGGTAYDRGTAASTEFAIGADINFDKLYRGSGAGTLHFWLTSRFGTSLSSAIANPASVEEIYGDGAVTRITIFDYEQPLAKGRVNLRLGKYNQQDDYVPGSTYWGGSLDCFYQNQNICGTPAGNPFNGGVVANGSEGYVYYPSSQWGARLRAYLGSATYVQAAVIEGNPLVNNKTGGLYFGLYGGTGAYIPVEIGVLLKDRQGNLRGTVGIGGYYDTSNVENYATLAAGYLALSPFETNTTGLASNAAALASIKSTYVRGRSGLYVQMDHLIGGQSGPGKSGTALFASAEYGDPQSSLLSTTFDIGIVRHGTFPGRVNDTIAIAFASDDYNVRLQRLEAMLQSQGFAVPSTVQDQVIELTYGLQANSWFVIRPGFQYVIHPGGIAPNPGVGVINPPRNALVFDLAGYIAL
jgi:porin